MDRQQHIVIEGNEEEEEAARNVIFGKYEVGRVLGQGTFAKVYCGRNVGTNNNNNNNEEVAIKVISKEQVRKAGMAEAIEREISVMRMVRHPNVVSLKEVLATKGRIYFIMEYVKGGELFSKIAKGRLKEEHARKYFQQLISAVDYCHSRGVSHRDLKPENLLLDHNLNLKVTDFGLSALPEHLRQDGLLHTQCGTPAYVAPEVLRKKGYDGAKADIWSCGVILFALLSGYLPFQDVNMMNMYRKIFKGEYHYPPWFPADARRLVSKLLVVDPNRRLSIQGIIRQPWFRKDLFVNNNHYDDEQEVMNTNTSSWSEPKIASPRFFNAFDLISSMSSGFDLSSLFQNKKTSSSSSSSSSSGTGMFTSKCCASAIMAKFQGLANKLNYNVSSKDFKVRMQGREEGRKGRLSITAEVFEVAAEVTVVELSKSAGDTQEYVKFCEEEVRPALKDIVWSWQTADTWVRG